MKIQVAYNFDNDELFCVECKEQILLGEKYLIKIELVQGEIVEKPMHCTCIEEEEE